MKKISVIIPTYNSEKTIDRTINSIFSQEGINKRFTVEVLIIDDASTDSTIKRCSRYDNVKVAQYVDNSGGPNRGRNRGIKEATGDFIAFLDHDDEWLSNKLEHQLGLMNKYNQDFAYSTHIGKGLETSIQPNTSIYNDLYTWTNRNAGAYMSSILVKNKKIPLFKHPMVEYEWLMDITKTRRCIRTYPMVIRHVHNSNLSKKEAYRLADYELLKTLLTSNGIKRKSGSLARFYYKIENYKDARKYFLKANFSIKNVGYYLTSYAPPLARWIVKQFNVFG